MIPQKYDNGMLIGNYAPPEKRRKKVFAEYIIEVLRKFGGMKFVDYPAAMNLTSSFLASNWGASLASAATMTITSAIHKVTGTTQCTLVKIPTGFRGVFIFVPAAAFPTATGGTYAASDGTNESVPFASAQTCSANEPLICVTDGLLIYQTLSA